MTVDYTQYASAVNRAEVEVILTGDCLRGKNLVFHRHPSIQDSEKHTWFLVVAVIDHELIPISSSEETHIFCCCSGIGVDIKEGGGWGLAGSKPQYLVLL